MMNPFLQPIRPEKRRRPTAASEETAAQLYGHSVDTASPRPAMGLWIGNLLIKMGQRLTKQDEELRQIKEQA